MWIEIDELGTARSNSVRLKHFFALGEMAWAKSHEGLLRGRRKSVAVYLASP